MTQPGRTHPPHLAQRQRCGSSEMVSFRRPRGNDATDMASNRVGRRLFQVRDTTNLAPSSVASSPCPKVSAWPRPILPARNLREATQCRPDAARGAGDRFTLDNGPSPATLLQTLLVVLTVVESFHNFVHPCKSCLCPSRPSDRFSLFSLTKSSSLEASSFHHCCASPLSLRFLSLCVMTRA